jgi:hypothetical protein
VGRELYRTTKYNPANKSLGSLDWAVVPCLFWARQVAHLLGPVISKAPVSPATRKYRFFGLGPRLVIPDSQEVERYSKRWVICGSSFLILFVCLLEAFTVYPAKRNSVLNARAPEAVSTPPSAVPAPPSSKIPHSPVAPLEEESKRSVGETKVAKPDIKDSTSPPKEVPTSPRLVIPPSVANDMIVYRTQPQLPKFAQDAHISGTVVLKVAITKEGFVKDIQYVSGPRLLAPSVADEVRTWRYSPFLVANQPVDVETYVSVPLGFSDSSSPQGKSK